MEKQARTPTSEAPTLPAASDRLVYVSDDAPGISRERRGSAFTYRLPNGKKLSEAAQIDRIRRLAIPPAYTQVWICPSPEGHIQATGRDARGRKQYRYHADWREARDGNKFDRLLAFGAALPRIRAQVERDMAAPLGVTVQRETVLAAIVRLLDTTLVRVGNDEYARSNKSFGLTTLRNRHAGVQQHTVRLRFRGKSGVEHEVALHDRRVGRIVRRCQALPGQRLFEYLDERGEVRSIGSVDVNDYVRTVSRGEFTAKDFRTWHGSVEALQAWRELDAETAATPTPALVKLLLGRVAARLGNTVAVCRKSYVHPRVLALLTGELSGQASTKMLLLTPPRKAGLSVAERALLAFLKSSR